MEAKTKRHIQPGDAYAHLFPRSVNNNKTIRRNANVDHTVAFIPKVVQSTLDQTKRLAPQLKGRSVHETCNNIWQFVYDHINYKKDQAGYEQIRSPARAWHDRRSGVDCDCYSVFISSILTNLGIPHILRITKYARDYFQHIYPVVPTERKEIIIDCVTDQFDYEVPYSEKKDYSMDLQYLNGLEDDGMAELGNILKKNMAALKDKKSTAVIAPKKPGLLAQIKNKVAVAKAKQPPAASTVEPAPKKNKKGFFKKVLNVVNKVNPATVLLRNGVLAAMKLNIKNVAQRLRWSYLTAQQAAAKGIDPAKFQKLVATRQKLENIFYGAGGKESNFKKAILSGKGNKDKAVSGLGMLPMNEWNGSLNEHTPLEQLLGPDIYYSENVEGMEGFNGFGELGEPITLASVGAAMGVIAGIVASLKSVGNIFQKKGQGSEDFDESKTDAPENNVELPSSSPAPISPTQIKPPVLVSTTNTPYPKVNSDSAINPTTQYSEEVVPYNPSTRSSTASAVVETTEDYDPPITTANRSDLPLREEEQPTKNPSTGKPGFWDANKKWIKPVAIGVGGLTLVAIGYKMMKGSKAHTPSSSKSKELSGIPRKRKKKYKHKKSKHSPKKAIALL